MPFGIGLPDVLEDPLNKVPGLGSVIETDAEKKRRKKRQQDWERKHPKAPKNLPEWAQKQVEKTLATGEKPKSLFDTLMGPAPKWETNLLKSGLHPGKTLGLASKGLEKIGAPKIAVNIPKGLGEMGAGFLPAAKLVGGAAIHDVWGKAKLELEHPGTIPLTKQDIEDFAKLAIWTEEEARKGHKSPTPPQSNSELMGIVAGMLGGWGRGIARAVPEPWNVHDLHETAQYWQDHPVNALLDVVPIGAAISRPASIGSLAARFAAENPELSRLGALKVATKESYVPGSAARRTVPAEGPLTEAGAGARAAAPYAGGIGPRTSTVQIGGVTKTVQGRPWSRIPIMRSGQRAYDELFLTQGAKEKRVAAFESRAAKEEKRRIELAKHELSLPIARAVYGKASRFVHSFGFRREMSPAERRRATALSFVFQMPVHMEPEAALNAIQENLTGILDRGTFEAIPKGKRKPSEIPLRADEKQALVSQIADINTVKGELQRGEIHPEEFDAAIAAMKEIADRSHQMGLESMQRYYKLTDEETQALKEHWANRASILPRFLAGRGHLGLELGQSPERAARLEHWLQNGMHPEEAQARIATSDAMARAIRPDDPASFYRDRIGRPTGESAQELTDRIAEEQGRILGQTPERAVDLEAQNRLREATTYEADADPGMRELLDQYDPKNPKRAKGAPAAHKTRRGLNELVREMAGRLEEGITLAKDWYRNSGREILDATGGDVDRADLVAQITAIYSPQKPVAPNIALALRVIHDFESGRGVRFGDKHKRALARKALNGEDWLSSVRPDQLPKVRRFYANLLKHIEPSRLAQHGFNGREVTVDGWMGAAFGYGFNTGDAALTAPRFDFVEKVVQQLADHYGVAPEEAQAAIWTSIKAERDRSTAKLYANPATRQEAIAKSGQDFADAIFTPKNTFRLPFETTQTGDNWINDMSLMQQHAYTAEVGNAVLRALQNAGFIARRDPGGIGFWRHPTSHAIESNPQTAIEVAIGDRPVTRMRGKEVVDQTARGLYLGLAPKERSLIRGLAATVGDAIGQEQGGWARYLNSRGNQADVTAWRVPLGRRITQQEASALGKALPDAYYSSATGDGVIIHLKDPDPILDRSIRSENAIRQAGRMGNKRSQELADIHNLHTREGVSRSDEVESILREVWPDGVDGSGFVDTVDVAHRGELLNGSDYQAHISGSGRSDVLERIRRDITDAVGEIDARYRADPESAAGRHIPGGTGADAGPAAVSDLTARRALEQRPHWDELPRGATEFLDGGGTRIHEFDRAGPDTWVHELWHSAYHDLSETAQSTLNNHYAGGRPIEHWLDPEHENYAIDGERFVKRGRAPTPAIGTIFRRMGNWIKTVWKEEKRRGGTTDLPDDVREVFERMFADPKDGLETHGYFPHRDIAEIARQEYRSGVRPPARGQVMAGRPELADSVNRHANELIRYQTGRLSHDPSHLVDVFLRRLRFRETLHARDELWSMGTPLSEGQPPPDAWLIRNPDATAARIEPSTQAAVRGQPTKIPQDADSLGELEGKLSQDPDAIRQEMIARPGEHPEWTTTKAEEDVRWVPGKYVQRRFGDVFDSSPRGNLSSAGKLLTSLQRTTGIYGRPAAYLAGNIPFNTLALLSSMPVQTLLSASRAFRIAREDPALWRSIVSEGGETRASAGLPDRYLGPQGSIQRAEHRTTQVQQGIAGWLSRYADDPYRGTAFLNNAAKRGVTTRAELKAMIRENGSDLSDVRQMTREQMLDFDALNPSQQRMASELLYLWPFIYASIKWPAMFAREYPLRASIAGDYAARTGHERGEPNAIAGIWKKHGIDLSTINPLGPLADIAEQSSQFFKDPSKMDISVLQDRLTPTLAFMVDGMSGGKKNALMNFIRQTVPGAPEYMGHDPQFRGNKIYADRSWLSYVLQRQGRFFPRGINPEVVQERIQQFRTDQADRDTHEIARDQDWKKIENRFKVVGGDGPEIARSYKAWWDYQEAVDEKKSSSGQRKLTPLQTAQILDEIVRQEYPEQAGGLWDLNGMDQAYQNKYKKEINEYAEALKKLINAGRDQLSNDWSGYRRSLNDGGAGGAPSGASGAGY